MAGRRSAALAGVRICDLSGQLAGAGATRFLAAFGADVIRVEDPVRQGRWDALRGSPPYVDERRGIDLGGGFNNHNVEKRGITVDLKTEEGKGILRRLIAESDVVTENFAAGVLDRLGFGYEELRAIRHDIIYVSNCGFGQTGPYRSFKTWGPVVQAACGQTFLSGLPDRPAAGLGFSYMDHHGASFTVIAVLAALADRARTGEGQHIDISCAEAGATLLGPSILDHTVNGRPSRRPGQPHSNRSEWPSMVPHGIYAAAGDDDWVAIACRTDEDWRSLAAEVGEPWAAEDRFADLGGRRANEDELDGLLGRWVGPQDRGRVCARLRSRGVPVAAVQRPAERIDQDESTEAWGLWPTVHHREIGSVRVDGLPVHLSETDWVIERGAPCLGQHNHEVLVDLLGYTEEQVAEWEEAGIL